MVKTMTQNRRLLVVLLSVVVTLGMVISVPLAAYGEDQQIPEGVKIIILNGGDPFTPKYSFEVDSNSEAEFELKFLGEGAYSGTCTFIFEMHQNEVWGSLSSVHVPMPMNSNLKNKTIVGLYGAEHYYAGLASPENSIVLSVGSYRLKVAYSGDENWLPVETDWYEFAVVPDPDAPPPTDPNPTLTPPAKSTPTSAVSIASGSTKANKLNAAIDVPTASLTLNPVNGIYATGNAAFTLQKNANGKWKALSKKSVALKSGKAKYKLAKATDAASYRIQVSYGGDSKFNAVTTDWTTVKIAKGKGTVKKSLKVYSKASTKGKKLTTYKKGKKIVITGKSGKYYKVSLKIKGKTKIGYIAKTSVKVKK